VKISRPSVKPKRRVRDLFSCKAQENPHHPTSKRAKQSRNADNLSPLSKPKPKQSDASRSDYIPIIITLSDSEETD